MFVNNIDPVIFSVGPLSVRYYGLVYALGFLFLTYVFEKIAKEGKIKNLTKEHANNIIAYGLVSGLIGARISHVLGDLHMYTNLWDIFKVWEGGLGMHGGLLFGIATVYYYTKKHKISFGEVIDKAMLYLPFIIGIGRIANFTNSELYGLPTDLPWCVVFTRVDDLCRHPTQLYQAMSQFIIFGILQMINRFKIKKGTILWSFISLYGAIRFVTDFWREDVNYFFWINLKEVIGLTYTQVYNLMMVFIGVYMIYRLYHKKVRS